jgi:hypothetical protein
MFFALSCSLCHVLYLALSFMCVLFCHVQSCVFKLHSSGLWHCAVMWYDSNVLGTHAVFIFSVVLQNIGNLPHHCTMSQPRRLQLKCLLLWKPKVSYYVLFSISIPSVGNFCLCLIYLCTYLVLHLHCIIHVLCVWGVVTGFCTDGLVLYILLYFYDYTWVSILYIGKYVLHCKTTEDQSQQW